MMKKRKDVASSRHLSQSAEGHRLRLFGRGSPGGSGSVVASPLIPTIKGSRGSVKQFEALHPDDLPALTAKANVDAEVQFPACQIKQADSISTPTGGGSTVGGGMAIWGMKVTRGQLFAPSQEKKVFIYDINTKLLLHTLEEDVLKIEAKSNKHMYYAKKSDKAQQDHILVSWNVKDQQPSYVFIGHTKWITSFIVEGNRIFTSSADQTCRYWNPFNLEKVYCSDLKVTNEQELALAVQLYRDGKTKRETTPNYLRFVTESKKFDIGETVTGMAFCEDKNLVFISAASNDVLAFDIDTSEKVGVLTGHDNWVYAVVYNKGFVWTASRDQSIRCWNVQTFKCQCVFQVDTENLNTSKFKVVGHRLFVNCDDRLVRMYSRKKGKLVMAFPHEKKVRCFEVVNHPMYGKSLVTGSDDGLIRQWNIQTGKVRHVFEGHTGAITSLAVLDLALFSSSETGEIFEYRLAKLLDGKPRDDIAAQISAEERERKKAYEIMRRCFENIKLDEDDEDDEDLQEEEEKLQEEEDLEVAPAGGEAVIEGEAKAKSPRDVRSPRGLCSPRDLKSPRAGVRSPRDLKSPREGGKSPRDINVSAWQAAKAQVLEEGKGGEVYAGGGGGAEEEKKVLTPELTPEEIWQHKLEGLQNTFNLQMGIVARGCNNTQDCKLVQLDSFQLAANQLMFTTGELLQMLPPKDNQEEVTRQAQYTLSQLRGNMTLFTSYIEQVQRKYNEGIYIAAQERVDNAMTSKLAEKVKGNLKELITTFKQALSSPETLMQQRRKMEVHEARQSLRIISPRGITTNGNYNGYDTISRQTMSPRQLQQEQKALSPRMKQQQQQSQENQTAPTSTSPRAVQQEQKPLSPSAARNVEQRPLSPRGQEKASPPQTNREREEKTLEKVTEARTPSESEAGVLRGQYIDEMNLEGQVQFTFLNGLATCVPETRMLVTELQKPLAKSDQHDFAQAKVAISKLAPILQSATESGVVSDWKGYIIGLLDVIKGARGMAKSCGEKMAEESSNVGDAERISRLKETQKAIILSAGQMVSNTSGLISVTKALNENRFEGNVTAISNAKGVCKSKVQAVQSAIVALLSALKNLA